MGWNCPTYSRACSVALAYNFPITDFIKSFYDLMPFVISVTAGTVCRVRLPTGPTHGTLIDSVPPPPPQLQSAQWHIHNHDDARMMVCFAQLVCPAQQKYHCEHYTGPHDSDRDNWLPLIGLHSSLLSYHDCKGPKQAHLSESCKNCHTQDDL